MQYNVTEKFLILSLHPQKGEFIIPAIQVRYGLVGAFLLKMALQDFISIEQKKVVPKGGLAKMDKRSSEIFEPVMNAKKHRKVKYWLKKLASNSQQIKRNALNDLEDKQLIKSKRKKYLWIIPYYRYYLLDEDIRTELTRQIREAVLRKKKADEELMAVLGLVEACKLHKHIVPDKKEQKLFKKNLKQMIKDHPVADAISETVKKIQAALFAATAAGATVATTAGSN